MFYYSLLFWIDFKYKDNNISLADQDKGKEKVVHEDEEPHDDLVEFII